jgi:hypothetical protein
VIGRWAVERDKIYVSPWINSDELVVVEWDGVKTRFSGEDAVCDDSDFKRAVKLFVMREHARDFDSDYERYRYVTVDFHEALGDLIHECLQETQVRKTFPCAESYDVLAARRNKKYTEAADEETTVAAAAAAVTSYVFGIIGDYGASAGSGDYSGTNASAVATLVKGWSPEFIITTGDNAYAHDGSDPTYYPEGSAAFTLIQDTNIGQWYSDFIHPYGLAQSSVNGVQQYTSTATENKFFPAIGNHDIVEDHDGQSLTDTGLHWWKSYFSSLPGSKKYYSFTNGPVEFFCLFSNQRTGATTPYDSRIGNTIGSGQYDWLSTEMPNSSAHWKVVYFHNSPFTTESGGHSPGEDEMRWNFADLGADVVISGHAHNYERLKDGNDFPYLVCGASGAPLRASQVSSSSNYNLPDDATAVADLWKNVTTEKFYGDEHGAIRGTVADTELKFEFINKSGTVIDTYTITKALSDTTPTRTAS